MTSRVGTYRRRDGTTVREHTRSSRPPDTVDTAAARQSAAAAHYPVAEELTLTDRAEALAEALNGYDGLDWYNDVADADYSDIIDHDGSDAYSDGTLLLTDGSTVAPHNDGEYAHYPAPAEAPTTSRVEIWRGTVGAPPDTTGWIATYDSDAEALDYIADTICQEVVDDIAEALSEPVDHSDEGRSIADVLSTRLNGMAGEWLGCGSGETLTDILRDSNNITAEQLDEYWEQDPETGDHTGNRFVNHFGSTFFELRDEASR